MLFLALGMCPLAWSAEAEAEAQLAHAAWFSKRKPPPLTGELLARATNIALGAMNFMDTPYAWGGNTPAEGFDCSGFTRHIYQRVAGMALPRTSEAQSRSTGLVPVDLEDLAPGDLVFFNTLGRAFSHVGIYVGDQRFVHAPRTGTLVRTDSMRSPYWAQRFDGARRAR